MRFARRADLRYVNNPQSSPSALQGRCYYRVTLGVLETSSSGEKDP